MKTQRQYLAVMISMLLWLLAIGLFALMVEGAAGAQTATFNPDVSDNRTIPPVAPFEKRGWTDIGLANAVYTGEFVTYTIALSGIITDSYAAIVGVTDTLPTGLTVNPSSLKASAGSTGLVNGIITWTVEVATGNTYVLTYTAKAPVITATAFLTNTAVLYEIESINQPITPTAKTITATWTVAVIPRNVHMPLIQRQPTLTPTVTPTPTSTPTPTPTPQPLLGFGNYNFEVVPNLGWLESPAGLIYSLSQNFLAGTEGQRYAWLGGVNNQSNELSQTIQLPRGYGDLRVRYRYWIYSEESTCTNDLVQVLVNETSQTIETQDSRPHQLCQAGRTFGWKAARTANLAGAGGNTVTLMFRTQLNGSRNSNFFVDVVELCSDDPGATRNCNLTTSAVAAVTPVSVSSAAGEAGDAHGDAFAKP